MYYSIALDAPFPKCPSPPPQMQMLLISSKDPSPETPQIKAILNIQNQPTSLPRVSTSTRSNACNEDSEIQPTRPPTALPFPNYDDNDDTPSPTNQPRTQRSIRSFSPSHHDAFFSFSFFVNLTYQAQMHSFSSHLSRFILNP